MNLVSFAAACLLMASCAGTSAGRAATEAPGPPGKLPADRREADEVAKDAFLKLNFFAQGRGMIMTPGLVGTYKFLRWTHAFDRMLQERWGLIMERRDPVGLTEVNYQGMRIGVIGCAMCHTGRAAGRTIVGLGNKRFDIGQLAAGLGRIERAYAALTPADQERREVEDAAQEFVRRIAGRERDNLTQGMVPVSLVFSWFFSVAGEPVPADMTRGAVKIPALWGYGVKRHAGQFCDGYGDGNHPGWAVQVELTAGQKPETVRRYAPKIEAAEKLLAAFLPPGYPFNIDRTAAAKGSRIFTQNCRACHGSHERDGGGLPLFREPRLVEISRVQTDRDRLDARVASLDRQVEGNPLRHLIRHQSLPPGYFAPRLEGIWSRFPYLHNGSVPNLEALLMAPGMRPVVFSMKDAGERERFDEAMLGLALPDERGQQRLMKRGAQGDRGVYDTRRIGHSNMGHDFGTELPPADKRDLIEFLKTL